VFEDEPGHFGLAVVDHQLPPLLVIRNVGAASEQCLEETEPGIGMSAAAIADWLANHEGVVASEPTGVTLGGLEGTMVEVSMDPAWTATCPFSGGQPTVMTLVSASNLSSGFHWGLAPGAVEYIYLFDLPADQGGGNLLVLLDTCCGVPHETRLAEGRPVIDSLEFSLTG
jgi:hypothetical protein